MRNPLLYFLPLFCLAACPGRAQVLLVAAGQLHLSATRFADDAPGSDRLRLAPAVYDAEALGVAVACSPRTTVQATVGLLGYGIVLRQQREAGGAASTAAFQTQALAVALVARRYLPAAGPAGRWYAEAGADVLTEGFGATVLEFGAYDAANPNSPGLRGRATPSGDGGLRPGLRLGLGREWQVSPRQALAVQLVGRLGLRDFNRYRLETTTWQQGPTIDPVSYTNTLATRVSFVGVQARYSFQVSRLR